MRGKILALALVFLMALGSFGAVGDTIGTSKTFDIDSTQKIERDLIVSAGTLNGNQKAVIVGGGIGLYYADDDAINMKALLIANGWSANSITLLINSQATKSAVTDSLNNMASGSTASSISLFFFSGHGTSDQNGEAICCYDSNLYDYEFNSILDNFNGRVVTILDSCFSGGMPPSDVGGISVDQFIANFIEGATLGRGNENRVILMACAQDEYSYETGSLQSGIFSYFVREGLNGPADEQGNNNGVITAEETFSYAQPKTTQYESSQHPQIFDGDSSAEVPIIGIGDLSEMIFYGQDWDKDADGPDNPPIGDWQNDPPHAIRMGHEPFGSDATAWYMFDLGGNEVQEGLQVGIYFCDVGWWPFANGPSLYVYNWNSQSWTCLGENIADQDELVWQWKTTSNSNDYVDDNGLVWTKVYAESNDDTILDTIGIRFELVPPPAPDLTCIGSLSWTDVSPGSTVTGGFTVKNIGEQGSNLNWEVAQWPDWGVWTFSPQSGVNLPEDGTATVQVTVVAPNQENWQFSGEVKVVNADDSNDYEIIPVSLATPYNQPDSQQSNQNRQIQQGNPQANPSPNMQSDSSNQILTLKEKPMLLATKIGKIVPVVNANGKYEIEANTINSILKEKEIPSPPKKCSTILTIFDVTGGREISAKIRNDGSEEAKYIDWSIHVSGGRFDRIDKTFSNQILSLEPGGEEKITTSRFYGYGELYIEITLNGQNMGDVELTATGYGYHIRFLTLPYHLHVY